MNNDLQALFGGVSFNPAEVEPQADFEVLPPGKYPVLIENAEVKQTKSGTGHYVELTLKILDGPAKNRKLWDRINLQNPNAQCEEIGRSHLSALGRAMGLVSITDTAQLIGGVVIAHVKVKDDQNNVRTYSASGAIPNPPVQVPPVAVPGTAPSPLVEPGYTESSRAAVAPVAAPAVQAPTVQQVAYPQPTAAPPAVTPPVAPPVAPVAAPVQQPIGTPPSQGQAPAATQAPPWAR